jgi:hypothetical protein
MDPWAADRQARKRRRSSNRYAISRTARARAAVGVSAVVAPFAGAHPVGTTALDALWSAGLAALAAYLGIRAKRGPLIAAAVAAVLSVRSGPALAFAAVSVIAAAAATRNLRRRAVFARGATGGAAALALLSTSGHASPGLWLPACAVVIGVLVVSGFRNASTTERRVLRWGAVAVVAYCAVASVLAVVGVAHRARLIDAGTAELEAGLSSARRGDIASTDRHLDRAQVALGVASRDIGRWGALARVVPVTAQHVQSVTGVLDKVEATTTFASQATAVATDEALKVTAGRVDLSAVRELRGPLGRVERSLREVVDEVDEHDGGPLLPALRDRLEELRRQAARAQWDAAVGAAAVDVMPEVLGGNGERHYLVLFTSPSEARGRFGFPGSFAEVTFEDGRMLLGEHGPTSQALNPLDATVQGKDGDPQVRPYVPYGVTSQMLSVTIPPDWPTAAALAADLWRQSGRVAVDGVLRFDPASLARLMRLTGPIDIPGLTAPLDATNVEHFLLLGQYQDFPDPDPKARREVLDTVASTTFERLETADLPAPRHLVDLFEGVVQSGHLQVELDGRRASDLMDRLGLGGRFEPPASDGLMVTTVNGLGNKIDAFLSKRITYTGRAGDGTVDADLAVELTNRAPGSGLPEYVIGSFARPAPPPGTNRMSVFVYTAAPATDVQVDGQPVEVASGRTADGWYVHQLVVSIPSGRSATVSMHVAGDLVPGPYSLQIVPGGGPVDDDVTVDLRVRDGRVHAQRRIQRPAVLRVAR